MHSAAETARHWQGPFRGCAQKWQVAVQDVISLSWAGGGGGVRGVGESGQAYFYEELAVFRVHFYR